MGAADGRAAARRAPHGRAKTPKDPDPGKAFPGGEIYLSMPGLGDRLAARVAGEIGEHPEQFTTPNALQCYAGRAPVTRRSGRSEFTIARRLAYNRHLGEAVQQWAFCSLSRSAWAREFYDAKIAGGKTTTPHCAPWATAGLKSSGTACASASATTRQSTQPTATAPSASMRHEVDRGCLTPVTAAVRTAKT